MDKNQLQEKPKKKKPADRQAGHDAAERALMPRPERVVRAPVAMGNPRPVGEVLKDIPSEYLFSQMENPDPNVKACCRDISNLTYQLQKTSPDLADADQMVLTCGVCGCRHFRAAHGPGNVGA